MKGKLPHLTREVPTKGHCLLKVKVQLQSQLLVKDTNLCATENSPIRILHSLVLHNLYFLSLLRKGCSFACIPQNTVD